MKKQIYFLFFLCIVLSSFVGAKDVVLGSGSKLLPSVKLGIADLYCKLTGCTMSGDIDMGNNSIINANWVNVTYASIINYTYDETDPIFTNTNSSLARTGDCPAGYITMNTTTNGVECVSLSPTYYNATSSDIVTGTILGTIDYTQHPNGVYDDITINITEQVSAPSLDLRVNFTNGITSFDNGIMRYYTSSLSGTPPVIQLWDYTSNDWESFPSLTETESFLIIEQSVFDSSRHVENGVVQMRLYKSSTGNINNKYYIDWLAISKGFGIPAGEETDPFSLHKDGSVTNAGDQNWGGYSLIGVNNANITGDLLVGGKTNFSDSVLLKGGIFEQKKDDGVSNFIKWDTGLTIFELNGSLKVWDTTTEENQQLLSTETRMKDDKGTWTLNWDDADLNLRYDSSEAPPPFPEKVFIIQESVNITKNSTVLSHRCFENNDCISSWADVNQTTPFVNWNNTDTVFANGNYTGDVNIVGNVTANSFRADAHEQTISASEQTITHTGQNSVALTLGGSIFTTHTVGSTNPVFNDGTQIGQLMVLKVVNYGTFNELLIKDDAANGKVNLKGDKLFTTSNDVEDSLIVYWDGSLWQEIYRSLGSFNDFSGAASGWGNVNTYSGTGAPLGGSNVFSGFLSGFGFNNVATAYQTVFGRYSTNQGHATNWVATDDLFKIGIGPGAGSRADAFRLLKNGEAHWETDQKHYYGLNNDDYIQHDGTNQYFNSSGIHYFEQNVSVLNLIDRTVFWNDDLGSALEYSYDTKDIINDSQLADFEKSCYPVTDFDKPEEEEYIEEIINETGTYNETRTKIIYPHKKEECGRSISATMGRLSEVSNELNEVITIHNRSLVELDDGMITEHIYTQSKVIEDNVSYIEKINDKDKLKNKTSHYSYVNNVMGTELNGLDMEERVVVLEGAVNQLFTILCDKNILKKEDGCLK